MALVALAGPAAAGAWTQPKGKGQVIVKWETQSATRGYDPAGALAPLSEERSEDRLSLFGEYGLTRSLTLQVKSDWQSGKDAFVDYEGAGPLEVGLTWQAWRNRATAISVYAGYALAGEGRNAGYEAPGMGSGEGEVRASVGHAWASPTRLTPAGRSFVEVQTARRLRGGLRDETRIDLTYGQHLTDNWLVLNQVYAGQVDGGGARWATVETSVVRRVGDWSLQAGRRETLAGRETPDASGWVLGVWRRF